MYDSAQARDGRFGSKVGQIGPKLDKSKAFSDQISVHLAPPNDVSYLTSVVANLLFWSLGVTVASLCLVWVNTRAEERHDVLVT